MEAITLITLVAFVKKFVDSSKFLTNMNINALVTQAWTWLGGMVILAAATAADITKNIEAFGMTLGQLDGWSIILGGAMLGSGASVLYDFQAASDNSDTAQTPLLLPGWGPPNTRSPKGKH